jgi:cytochrome P450
MLIPKTPSGHGKDSCPGRFFATMELKVIITHLLLNYDLQFLPENKRPQNRYYGTTVAVDRTAEVMLKKRVWL